MAWTDPDSWATAAFAPKGSTIAFTLLVALVLPILLHAFIYRRAAAAKNLPAFLLLGPSGGGKTGFLTLAERKSPAQTHTSTAPSTVEVTLPSTHTPASSTYRSTGDSALEASRRFLLLDTPGHGKLRHIAQSQLSASASDNLRGIIYVVDAAAIADEAGLTDAASYLHDVLLALQKRHTGATGSKPPAALPVLVAANKMDLFTALPPHLVAAQLERAIGEVRSRRAKALREASAKGVLDAGAEEEVDEEREWLGEGGEGAFEFGMMEEVGVEVRVVGGSVVGGEGVGAWWEWVAGLL